MYQTEEEQNNLKTEDVFDENDKQLIEDLTIFIEQYQYQVMTLQDQIRQMNGFGSMMEGDEDGE